MVNQSISQTERDADVKEVSDKCSYLITANAPWCSEQDYRLRGAVESGLYQLKPPHWNGRSNRRQVGEVLLVSTVVAAVMAIVHLLLVMSGDVEENPGPLGQHTQDPLDMQCSEEHIYIIAKFNFEWKTVGRRLITTQTINDIDREEHSEQDKRDRMLERWLESNGSGATYRVLINVLRDVRNSQVAEEVRKLVEDTQKLYDEAMKYGYVDRKIIKCLIIGAAGVGKTTIKHLLLGKEPPEKRVSTGVMENPVHPVSISKAGYHNGSWCTVETDEDLMKMIAEAIKSKKVPMENVLVGSHNETMAEHNDDGMLHVPADTELVANTDTAESIHIDTINNSEGGERFLSTSWIHIIDSGGQPQFHDLLSLFIPNTQVVLFIFNLSESLHHKPKVEYFDSLGPIGNPYDSYLTHKEILEHSIRTIHKPSGNSPIILVIGTHKDCKQKLEIADLKKCLAPAMTHVVHFGRDPIALVDCLSKHSQERDDVIEGIRSTIMEVAESIKSQKIPLAWFGLEMELKKASKPNAGILSIVECKKVADKFPFFKNNRGQFDAALQHLVEQNIFLHYPEILPDIVFCDPQVLLNEVTRIVQYHYMIKNSKRARRGDEIKFVDNGYISTTILKTINKDNKLIPHIFLELLSQLNIISSLGRSDLYLMPALLSNAENPVSIISVTGKETSPPLCITFDGGCVPSGLFCSLVAHLLQSENWELSMNDDTPSCCFQNCVAFVYCGESIVTLMDLFTHFRVYVQTQIPSNDAPLTYQQIRDKVHTSIDKVHTRSKLTYADAILCPAHPEQDHVAMWHSSHPTKIYQCTLDNSNCGPIPKGYEVWMKTLPLQADTTAGMVQPSNEQGPSGASNGNGTQQQQIHEDQNVPSPPIGLKADSIRTTSISISWQPPHDPNGIIMCHQVSYTPHGESECIHEVVGDTTNTELTSLKPHTEYTIRVRAKTVDFGEYSTPITVSTLEDVPSPPIGLKADSIRTTSMSISWQPPHDPNGIIICYQVSYTPHGESECLHDVVGDTTNTELTSLKPHTEYTIHMRAKTVDFGDYSTPITVSTLEEDNLHLFKMKIMSILDNYKHITFKQLRIIKLIFYGTPRTGKTTLRKQLLRSVEDQSMPDCGPVVAADAGTEKDCTANCTDVMGHVSTSHTSHETSTPVAEICDHIFVERIVMTNEENNAWRWSVQKLDDIAKTLLQCLDNQLLQCEKEVVYVREGPNMTAAQRPTPAPLMLLNQNEEMASTLNLNVAPSLIVMDTEKNHVPNTTLPITVQDETSSSSTDNIDINKLFSEAVENDDWSGVVKALNIDKAMLMQVIDGGGQPSFQEIFPLLISGPSVTLLMFKLTDDLQKAHDVWYQPIDGAEHTWKDIYVVRDFIFHAISSMVRFTKCTDGINNSFDSKILLVGTHKDRIEGSDEQKKAEIKKIKESIYGWLREFKGFQSILYVTNIDDIVTGISNLSKEDIQMVKMKIEELVSRTPSKDIPAPWLVFDFVLHTYARSQKLRKVEKIKCKQIANKCGVKDEKFEVVLQYLHYEAGTLLYYSDIPELRDCVITDFQLIFDSISKIIIDYFDDSRKDGSANIVDKDLLHGKGHLNTKVLKDIEGCLKVNELLSLMQHRHIISKMDGDMFFMPSVLPKAEPSNKKSGDSCSFLVMFEHGCCPIGLFCAVTTSLIVTHKWRVKKDEPQFRDRISLYCYFSGKSYYIIFSAFFAHYEICVMDRKAKPNIKNAIYKVINEVFKTVCKDMNYPTPLYGFYCPKKCTYGGVTHLQNEHPAKCTFDTEAQEMICCYSDEPSDLTEEHKSWFQEVQTKEKINAGNYQQPGNYGSYKPPVNNDYNQPHGTNPITYYPIGVIPQRQGQHFSPHFYHFVSFWIIIIPTSLFLTIYHSLLPFLLLSFTSIPSLLL